MTERLCSVDNELTKLLEEGKKSIQKNEIKINSIKREMIKIKKNGREIDRRIRLLL